MLLLLLLLSLLVVNTSLGSCLRALHALQLQLRVPMVCGWHLKLTLSGLGNPTVLRLGLIAEASLIESLHLSAHFAW